jgi:hypothetical protein
LELLTSWGIDCGLAHSELTTDRLLQTPSPLIQRLMMKTPLKIEVLGAVPGSFVRSILLSFYFVPKLSFSLVTFIFQLCPIVLVAYFPFPLSFIYG